MVDGWDLLPGVTDGDHLALAVMLFQHPTMGQMVSCIILADGVSKSALEQGLLEAGAEPDGNFAFMEGIGRLWFVSSGGRENGIGEGILIATTPNGPLQD